MLRTEPQIDFTITVLYSHYARAGFRFSDMGVLLIQPIDPGFVDIVRDLIIQRYT